MIKYPYLPPDRTYLYVSAKNQYMVMARDFAQRNSLDKTMPGAAVIVKNGCVLGMGANGSDYHEQHPCQRIILGCKTGEGYEFCEGYHPKNHSEARAIKDAQSKGHNTTGADLYLWGHWWCCKSCWDVMVKAGVKNIYLLEGSEKFFNKEHPENIVGRQFEAL